MKLYNTASRTVEEIEPLEPPTVTFYACGSTVYDYTHIGHIRTYLNEDILKRALTRFGYKVKHVMNITDVGHLTGDDDSGEDKLEKGAQKAGQTVFEVAKFYTDFFTRTIEALGISMPDILCKATEHIPSMIKLIEQLKGKGFTYQTNEAIYFDTSKFKGYGSLSGQNLDDKLQKAREEVYVDSEKKSPTDFALWFFRVGRFKDHTMHWESPWGDGFPGWHIECSAMSMQYLGETIDIHAGGIDHIPVHHENEIAQSEAATGKPFVKDWFHNNFLTVNGAKMSKSLSNFYTIEDVNKRGIDPLAIRLLFLQTHYRAEANFTWEALDGAATAYNKLRSAVATLKTQTDRSTISNEKLAQTDEYRTRFDEALASDLQTAQALAVVWEVVKSNIPSRDKLDLLYSFDEVLGLDLKSATIDAIPADIQELADRRQALRREKKFDEADTLRQQIEKMGYTVEDIDGKFTVKKS